MAYFRNQWETIQRWRLIKMCAGMPEVLLTQMFPKVGPAELGFALGWGQSTVGELSIKISGEIRTVNLPEKLNQCQCPEEKKF